MIGKIGWIITGALAAFFVALAFYNSTPTDTNTQDNSVAWNDQMVRGASNAPNTFVEYTDITCPHCANFHNVATDSSFDKDYIDSGKVRMEIRTTSLLSNVNSVRAGESAYCAADQGKFYAYYDEIVKQFTKDYFNKGIGISPTSPKVPKLDDSYYINATSGAGLNVDEMKTCLDSGEKSSDVEIATQKAINQGVMGVPAFDVNNGTYTGSGFGGGYSTIEQMMKAGGVN